MSDPKPERTVPNDIEMAMREVTAAAFDFQDIMGRELAYEIPRVTERLNQAKMNLRQAILAALSEAKEAGKKAVLDEQYEEGRSHDYA